MNTSFPLLSCCAILGLSLIANASIAQSKLYRWVDSEGNVHYTDHIPPEFANRDREVLNDQAVQVGFEEGEITAEERAEQERLEAVAATEQRERDEAARRDKMLLDTYLSVEDIEDLRDRRLELIDSRIRVTEFYLSNLRRRLESLQNEKERYAPLSDREDAPPLPEFLALDIERTRASIELYEETLNRSRDAQHEMRAAFELDIERFRELRGG